MGLWNGALPEYQKGGQRRKREQASRNQHGARDQLNRRLPLPLGPGHIGQPSAQTEQAADKADAPAPAGNLAHGLALCQFWEEGGNEVFSDAKEESAEND